MYFQPKFDLVEDQVTGLEALVRWNHAEYGFIPPDEFVPVAERSGVIRALTRWVMKQSLECLFAVERAGV